MAWKNFGDFVLFQVFKLLVMDADGRELASHTTLF